MQLQDHGTRWIVFAVVAIAVSYALRLVASRGTKAGVRRVASAREALGLGAYRRARGDGDGDGAAPHGGGGGEHPTT